VQVRGIETKNLSVSAAPAGTVCEIGLKLPADFDITYLKKGNVLCDPKFEMPLVRKFVARIIVFDLPFGAITKGEQVMIHCYTSKCPGKLISLLALVDQKTGAMIKERPKFLK
jgi:translation elongation factor EF-1alpha